MGHAAASSEGARENLSQADPAAPGDKLGEPQDLYEEKCVTRAQR